MEEVFEPVFAEEIFLIEDVELLRSLEIGQLLDSVSLFFDVRDRSLDNLERSVEVFERSLELEELAVRSLDLEVLRSFEEEIRSLDLESSRVL